MRDSRRKFLQLAAMSAIAPALGCNRIYNYLQARRCKAVDEGNGAARPPVERAMSRIPEFERNFRENLLGFWYPRCLDRKNAGYLVHFRNDGSPDGDTTKALISQTRTLWVFSHAARLNIRRDEMLEAAELGYRFLRDKMWDKKSAGFFWSTNESGDFVVAAKKHLFGQVFGIFALSEYYLASGQNAALDLTNQTFALIEQHAHDDTNGGYIECLEENWSPSPPESGKGYIGLPPGVKTLNTHMHALEAFSVLYSAEPSAKLRERLLELIELLTNRMFLREYGCAAQDFQADWTPQAGDLFTTSYGHNLEIISRIMFANDALGLPNGPLLPIFEALVDYTLMYGCDARCGGVWDSGPVAKRAQDLQKTWWAQAEAMLTYARLYELTHAPRYADLLDKTWLYTTTNFVDWQRGGWYETIMPDGSVAGSKGNLWKDAYHDGWAMMDISGILRKAAGNTA